MVRSGRPRGRPTASTCQVGAQLLLVDLPIAVLNVIEEHHGQPIAEFRAQGGVPGRGQDIDIRARQDESELVGQLDKLSRRALAHAAAGAGEQRHAVAVP